MNIQGANLLSSLSGAEGLGNLQQSLGSLTGDQAGFASALMEQLGLLQDSLAANPASVDLAGLQSLMSGSEGDWQQELQNFAAHFGQDLPVVNKAAPDIDLEDTLQTLSDVLQQLQQLEVEPQNADLLPVIESQETKPELLDAAPADSLQMAEQAAVAAVVNNPVPAAVTVAVPETELAEASDGFELSKLFSGSKKPTTAHTQDERGTNQTANVNAEDSGVEFDRSISAMLGRDDAAAGSQQDKPSANFKSDTLVSKLAADAPASVDSGKSPADIAGDISRMNQVVRNESVATAPTGQPALIKHFSDPGWQQELGDKLIWMHKQSIPSAELRLNPEHLGPILVKIDVSHEQATIAFTAQHLAVKEAIEAAIPKLREMLGGQQLNLADVNVSQQQSDQKQPAREFFQMASEQNQRRQSDLDGQPQGVVNEAQNIVDEIEAGRAIASQGLLSLFA